MKRIVFTLCLAFLSFNCFSQDYPKGVRSLKDFLALQYSAGSTIVLDLALNKGVNQISFYGKDDSTIADYLGVSEYGVNSSYKDSMFYKNQPVVIDYYKNHVESILHEELTTFSFVQTATDQILYLGTHFYDKIFNSLRTEEKERAKTVVSDLVLPQLYEAYKCFHDTDFKTIGIGCLFLNRDFSQGDSYFTNTPDEETVIVFLNLDDIRDCVDEFLLTEEELLKKASIYLLSESGKRKVSLF